MSFNFPPKGWALCNGQFLPINQNQALFSLLGTMYGGNGQTTFALPDLRGRVPIHVGAGFTQGEAAGARPTRSPSRAAAAQPLRQRLDVERRRRRSRRSLAQFANGYTGAARP